MPAVLGAVLVAERGGDTFAVQGDGGPGDALADRLPASTAGEQSGHWPILGQ
jgi:hypothetical protein